MAFANIFITVALKYSKSWNIHSDSFAYYDITMTEYDASCLKLSDDISL